MEVPGHVVDLARELQVDPEGVTELLQSQDRALTKRGTACAKKVVS